MSATVYCISCHQHRLVTLNDNDEPYCSFCGDPFTTINLIRDPVVWYRR